MFGAGLICGAYMTKVAPALPLQRAELGLTLVESGFIATTFNVMGGVLGIFAGTFCDRYGHAPRSGSRASRSSRSSGLLGAAAHGLSRCCSLRASSKASASSCSRSPARADGDRGAQGPRDRAKALGLWGAYMPTGGGLALLIAPPLIAAWGWRGLWVAARARRQPPASRWPHATHRRRSTAALPRFA